MSNASRFWVGTSWKMNKTLAEARAYSDERAALSTNAKIITMGASVIGPELACPH